MLPCFSFSFSRRAWTISEYDPTQSVFCNSYPWLFPGGVGDLYDIVRGTKCPKERGRHLLHYYDGRFLEDQMFSLFLFNSIERHENNKEGSFFFNSKRFLGKNPPTLDELKAKLMRGDDRYIQVLRYYAQTIKGSDNYWRVKQMELESWIQHHVSRGRGPPTFFITFSVPSTGGPTYGETWHNWRGTQVTNLPQRNWRRALSKQCNMLLVNIRCLLMTSL